MVYDHTSPAVGVLMDLPNGSACCGGVRTQIVREVLCHPDHRAKINQKRAVLYLKPCGKGGGIPFSLPDRSVVPASGERPGGGEGVTPPSPQGLRWWAVGAACGAGVRAQIVRGVLCHPDDRAKIIQRRAVLYLNPGGAGGVIPFSLADRSVVPSSGERSGREKGITPPFPQGLR